MPGGMSKHGWPILECYVSRWRPFDYDNEEHQRLISFFFRLALTRNPQASMDGHANTRKEMGRRISKSMLRSATWRAAGCSCQCGAMPMPRRSAS